MTTAYLSADLAEHLGAHRRLRCRFGGGRSTAVNENCPRDALDAHDEARWAVVWWYRHVQCQLVDRP